MAGSRCQHEGADGLAAKGFGVVSLQGGGHAEEQRASLFGLTTGLDSEPASFAGGEEFQRQAGGLAGAELDGVMAGLVGLHVLGFHPEWSAAGLLLVKEKRRADGAGERFA